MKLTVFEWETVCGSDLSPAALNDFGEVRFFGKPAPEEVPEIVGDSDAVICSKVVFSREVIAACPRLRYIGLMATGYNNIDLVAAAEKGIVVTNIPSYSTDAVSQTALAFILQFATNLIRYDASTRRGDWTRSRFFCYYPYPMTELRGKTLGLLGLGNIGSQVARLGDAFGMRVIYHARSEKNVPYAFVSLEELFRESDFLSLHCPLTAETQKVVCETTLALMKPTTYLVNTARGGLVDESALASALRSGKLAGFAADVLETEPQRADCPLLGLENCVLTPHIAWAPKETRVRLWDILVANLFAWKNGEPQNVVRA